MYFDTHAHLCAKQFDNDLDDVINNAKQAGVSQIIAMGMNEACNIKSIDIANANEGIYAAVGIHPSCVDEQNLEDVEPLLKDKKVVAIGEIGIDLYWRKDNLDKQKKYFVAQIELAIKHDLPIVIHTRNAFKQAYDLVLPFKGKVKGVFHCFSSNHLDALKVVDLGFHIGIGAVVTYPNAKDMHEVAKYVPLDYLLIETDSPYLTPHPNRTKRNEPANVVKVAEKIAQLKNLPVELIAKATTKNAEKLFKVRRDINNEKNS